jgi:hypothetical protein
MSGWIGRGTATAGAAVLGTCLMLAAAGCGTARAASDGHRTALRNQDPDKIVLARGRMAGGQRWKLVAFEQGHQVGLDLDSPSGHNYSGQISFAASRDYSYYWGEGLGPGGSTFYYGPVPGSAIMVRLTAPGHRPLLVRTAPLPARRGLPAGRFFIVQSPSSVSVSWWVTPLDAAGHRVAFRDF